MRKLLAISGGVDSVCLLHMYKDDPEILVAHFNHGTRPSSKDDEVFAKNLAEKYGKKFIVGHANLGSNVSEEKARNARYEFLRKTAKEENAEIYTAHHTDDLIETIAINLLRGTGWRGLVPLDANDIVRPLIKKNYDKKKLLQYAAENNLSFRQDPTNNEDNYLRNRVREKLKDFKNKTEILEFYNSQKNIKQEIETIFEEITPKDKTYQRAWFKDADSKTAIEFLRHILKSENLSLTRPKLEDFLDAIKTYAPEKSFNLPGDRLVKIHKTYFVL